MELASTWPSTGTNHTSHDRAFASITDHDVDVRTLHTDDGDHDKFAHYASKADITASAVNGTAVTAICGKKWVPTRTPDGYPVCPDCKKIYEAMKAAGR